MCIAASAEVAPAMEVMMTDIVIMGASRTQRVQNGRAPLPVEWSRYVSNNQLRKTQHPKIAEIAHTNGVLLYQFDLRSEWDECYHSRSDCPPVNLDTGSCTLSKGPVRKLSKKWQSAYTKWRLVQALIAPQVKKALVEEVGCQWWTTWKYFPRYPRIDF